MNGRLYYQLSHFCEQQALNLTTKERHNFSWQPIGLVSLSFGVYVFQRKFCQPVVHDFFSLFVLFNEIFQLSKAWH